MFRTRSSLLGLCIEVRRYRFIGTTTMEGRAFTRIAMRRSLAPATPRAVRVRSQHGATPYLSACPADHVAASTNRSPGHDGPARELTANRACSTPADGEPEPLVDERALDLAGHRPRMMQGYRRPSRSISRLGAKA